MNDTLSLSEASKLLQFAPQTVKKMIEKGELKAQATGTGKKRRYTIKATDLPVKAKKMSKVKKARKVSAKKRTAKKQAAVEAMQFISKPFTPDPAVESAEQLLRNCFLQWCAEKLLGR